MFNRYDNIYIQNNTCIKYIFKTIYIQNSKFKTISCAARTTSSCMYSHTICIRAYIRTSYVRIYKHTYIHMCINSRSRFIFTYTHMHSFRHINIHQFVHQHKRVHMLKYPNAYTCIHAYIPLFQSLEQHKMNMFPRIHTHTHTHTYIQF